jgi:hypothetical protein
MSANTLTPRRPAGIVKMPRAKAAQPRSTKPLPSPDLDGVETGFRGIGGDRLAFRISKLLILQGGFESCPLRQLSY